MSTLTITYPYTRPEVKAPPWWLRPFRLGWYQQNEDYLIFCAWRRCGCWEMPVNQTRHDRKSGLAFTRTDEVTWRIDPAGGSLVIGP